MREKEIRDHVLQNGPEIRVRVRPAGLQPVRMEKLRFKTTSRYFLWTITLYAAH